MPLVVVKDKTLPLIAALPFNTIDPVVKPPPKLIPPEELPVCTVKPFVRVELCPSVLVTVTLRDPTTAAPRILILAVI